KLFDLGSGKQGAKLPPTVLTAPRSGRVLAVLVSPGQYVSAAAPLLTFADLGRLWVRVPVPEYDLPPIQQGKPATVYLPGTAAGLQANGGVPNGGRRTHVAAFKATVHQVDPVRHTADLLYELPPEADKSGLFAKDQMVAVLLPLGGEEEETVVP